MESKFTVAPITASDNLALKRVIQSTLIEYGDDLPNSTYSDPVIDDLFDFYQKTLNSQYYVVKAGSQVLGGGGFAPYTIDGVAEVQKLFLTKATRGHGMGKKIMNMVEQAAKQLGYHQLYIETFSNMHEAIGLYQHVGFKKLEKPLLPMSHTACDVVLAKSI